MANSARMWTGYRSAGMLACCTFKELTIEVPGPVTRELTDIASILQNTSLS